MKAIKAFLLLLALGLSVHGQAVNVTANKLKGSATAPSGACSAQQVQLTTAGVVYTCQAGTWGTASASSTATGLYYAASYGMVCDGNTSRRAANTTALQAAIDAAPSPGGTVILPPGVCMMGSGITLQKSTRILGQSKSGWDGIAGDADVTVLDFTTLSGSQIAITGPGNSANVELAYFRLDGPNSTPSTVGIQPGIFGANVSIHDLFIYHFGTAIKLDSCKEVDLQRNFIEGAWTKGLWVKDTSYLTSSGNNYANTATGPNIYVAGGLAVDFYDPKTDEAFGANVASIQIVSGSDISINNMLVLFTHTGYGIRLGDGSDSPTRVTLNNVRVQPFLGGYTSVYTILATGSEHRFINVTTSTSSGGDVSDTSTNPVYVNFNGATNLQGTLAVASTSGLDGLSITRNATGSGTTATATSSGSDAGFRFTPKGAGNFTLTTGQVILAAQSGVGLTSATPRALSSNVLKVTDGATGWGEMEVSFIDVGQTSNRKGRWRGDNGSINLAAGAEIGWNSGSVYNGGTDDLALERVSANVIGIKGASSTGATIRSVPSSPSQITSDQNNYNPGRSLTIRLSTDASRTLTGLNPGAGTNQDGEWHMIVNVGSNDLVLAHESASSTAGNRFLSSTGASLTLTANQSALVIYDSTSARWRVFKQN